MLLPSEVIKRGKSWGGRSGALYWHESVERAMNAMGVVILCELSQLMRQVARVPEKNL